MMFVDSIVSFTKSLHRNFLITSLVLLFIAMPSFGQSLTPKDIEMQMSKVHRVGLLPLKMQIVEIFPGNLVETREDWTDKAKEVTVQILRDYFQNNPLSLTDLTSENKPESYDEIIALFERVAFTLNAGVMDNASIVSLPGRAEDFDYTLGDVSSLFTREDLDAILLVTGSDGHLTTGRKISEGASAVFKLMFGVVDFANPQGVVNMALVSKSGDILWYGSDSFSGTDFREYNIHQYLMGRILEGFPSAER